MSILNNPALDDANKDQTFIYTTRCSLCASKNEYSRLIEQIKDRKRVPVVKQITLWPGWQKEATDIENAKDVKVPFIFDYNTKKVQQLSEEPEEVINTELIQFD